MGLSISMVQAVSYYEKFTDGMVLQGVTLSTTMYLRSPTGQPLPPDKLLGRVQFADGSTMHLSNFGLLFDEGVEIALTQGDDGRIASVMMLACQEDGLHYGNCLCVRSNIGISLINYLSIGQYYFSQGIRVKYGIGGNPSVFK